MRRILLIDGDRAGMQRIGLECLERGVAVVMAETLCEGVRALLDTSVSLVVADARLLRLSPRESAVLLERVAPGAEIVAACGPEIPLETRVAYEVAGFRTVSRPLVTDDLLAKGTLPAV